MEDKLINQNQPGSLTSLGDVDCMLTEMFGPQGKSYKCLQCERVVAQKINMKKQIETHLPAIPWPCEHSGKVFKAINSLKSHVSKNHRSIMNTLKIV